MWGFCGVLLRYGRDLYKPAFILWPRGDTETGYKYTSDTTDCTWRWRTEQRPQVEPLTSWLLLLVGCRISHKAHLLHVSFFWGKLDFNNYCTDSGSKLHHQDGSSWIWDLAEEVETHHLPLLTVYEKHTEQHYTGWSLVSSCLQLHCSYISCKTKTRSFKDT